MARNTTKSKVHSTGISPNLQEAIDDEWTQTERSDAAEAAILREYHYHMLRAEELSIFLRGVGCEVRPE